MNSQRLLTLRFFPKSLLNSKFIFYSLPRRGHRRENNKWHQAFGQLDERATGRNEKQILKTIIVIRGKKVILDSDLAKLYGVETRRLNEQVRRNSQKFPDDFMFQLTKEEFANLKSQIATSSSSYNVPVKRGA